MLSVVSKLFIDESLGFIHLIDFYISDSEVTTAI